MSRKLLPVVDQDELYFQELENSCVNPIDYQILALDELKERHKKRYKKNLRTKTIKKPGTEKRRVIFKILPAFTRQWVAGSGETEVEAMERAIEKLKRAWPQEKSKVERFIRIFRQFSRKTN